MIASFALFAVVIYLMGLATVQLATGRYRLDLDTHVMCSGIGLGVFAVTTVVLNTFHVALSWFAFLLAACGLFMLAALRDILARHVSREERRGKPLWTKDSAFLLAAVLLAGVMLVVYLHGAFYSQWLTDEDSWYHAVSAKYVASKFTYSVPIDIRHAVDSYLEPYPPAYPVLMGVLHQVSASLYWTLKFFNVLIVSLAVVYFFIWVREWTKDSPLSLWITGVVWILPCFMSHFIWAQTMSLAMFFPAFWALEKSREEPRWNIVAAVMVAGMFLTQPSSPVVFMLMAGIYWIVNLVFAARRTPDGWSIRGVVWQGVACAAGALFSLVHYLPALNKFGWEDFVRGITRSMPGTMSLKVSGVGRGRGFGLWDFIWAPSSSSINQPRGVGLVLFLAACAGLVLLLVRWHETKRSRWKLTMLAWLVLTLAGLEAEYLPVSLFPHRFWVFFAIPVAAFAGFLLWRVASALKGRQVIAAVVLGAALGAACALFGLGEVIYRWEKQLTEGAEALAKMPHLAAGAECAFAGVAAVVLCLAAAVAGLYSLTQEAARPRKWWTFGGVAAVVAGIALTSGFAKADLEGFSWWDAGRTFYKRMIPGPDGRPVRVENDLLGYVLLRRRLPPNTPVLGLTCREERIIGFDMFTPPLDQDTRTFRRTLAALPTENFDDELIKTIHLFATMRKYAFVTVDHHWASFPMLDMAWAQQRITKRRGEAGMSRERLADLIEGKALPTPREEPALEKIRKELQVQDVAIAQQEEMTQRVTRLRELLEKSPLFEKKPLDSEGKLEMWGVTVFKVVYPEEKPAS